MKIDNDLIKRRREKYQCNGYCYGYKDYETGESICICGNIDNCDETRKTEFLATLSVILFFALITVVPAVIMLFMLWRTL